ncbi:DNA-binding response OmpR family regulator [Arthrobacter stackebrandtii]|uniref:DNA-binding response OmpR family regulator n=1 Tax=Arthrobacter stackebrandtii TaxID=272161 RepID=A0ABS4YUG6_9MICC|nr:response regulator transcription factor [Arthrobacter stackebrandtii]MBP2412433.1 DNA-binding response OmpR family regulator [Arthrobacter stackebrandtii]PYH02379.1 DNA-binding response regulator [Arthrobacter stackebrandtii]
MARILLVEDDPDINAAFRLALAQRGHSVHGVFLGHDGVSLATADPAPELVVLDLMLPDLDGREVCRRIREVSTIPIIMMTARGDDADVVLGLESGADDYVVKPVEPYLLDARIRALLRRSSLPAAPVGGGDVAASGTLVLDRKSLVTTKNGETVPLTATETRLLLELSNHRGQVRSRVQLLREVWGTDYLNESRIVDACIQRLRSKIEDEPAQPKIIATVRGFGYRFDGD